LRNTIAAIAVWGLIATQSARSDTGPPAEAIRLSKVAEILSQDEALRERLLQSLDSLPNAWGLLGSKQRTRLRNFILDRNWTGIDHFPALTVGELRASVAVANAAASKYPGLTAKLEPPYVEVGPFAVTSGGDVDWQAPKSGSGKELLPPVKDLGYGLTMGDPPHPELWKWHGRSVRAAYLLNRLALNSQLDEAHRLRVHLGDRSADSPEGLIDALDHSGYELWIEDSRYFANFGHLHFKGRDVMMPFWLDTKISLPHSKETLLVPVSHAEEEIRIRGPQGNADVSFYFGIDGMTEFRTMDTLDQYWVGKNVAHEYRHAQAVEVARLLGAVLRKYATLQHEYSSMPFNGYYRFGVCQDGVAAIEFHMTGKESLFPITHDSDYFKGSGEVDRLFSKIPTDRGREKADWSRVLGSLPAKNLTDIRIPELASQLELVEAAEKQGREVRGWSWTGAALAIIVAAIVVYCRRKSARRANANSVLGPRCSGS
jgi:hypothetical protein